MDDCRFTRSPSVSSFDTNHSSSWSFIGEDDFDLLDEDGDDSASEGDLNEMEDERIKKDEQQQIGAENDADDDDDDDDYDDDDNDDISVVTEEDILNDPATLKHIDVVEVSKQLDEFSKCFDSPFTRIVESFALERNIKFGAIISAAAISIVIFYYAYGFGKPELTSFTTSMDNVCFTNEDHVLGLQYRDTVPSLLRPVFETLLKPSLPAWFFLPSFIPKPQAIEHLPQIFKSDSIISSQDEPRHFATNQCERVSIEHQFNAASETVRRYLKHKKKMPKLHQYELSILRNVNETAVLERKDTKVNQHDLHAVITIDASKNSISTETGLSEDLGSIEMKTSKLQNLPSISKLILSISPFSANHFLLQSKLGLSTSVSSLDLPVQKEEASFSINAANFNHVEEKCLNAKPDIKTMKSLEKKKTKLKLIKSFEKKRTKLQYSTELSLLFEESKVWQSAKLFGNDFKKEMRRRKKGKNEDAVISSMKKALSKVVERARVHRDKLLEQFSKTVVKITQKNRPKIYQMSGKANISKERCVLNSTCNVLASLARTLAGISLFPAIVGQSNAAKYISSLLDLSTCTGLRLVCERCWWTRDCCPKERCTFLQWQQHFNTKRFLASQGHKMFPVFEELGWPIPGTKHKGGSGKPKFKLDKLNRSAGSEKEMRSRQNKKKSMERCLKKNYIQGCMH